MQMTIGRAAAGEREALFFTPMTAPRDIAGMDQPAGHSRYGQTRGPRWPAIIAILALHIAGFQALVTLDMIEIAPRKKTLVVFNLVEPPAPPVLKPEAAVSEKVDPVAESPSPLIQPVPPAGPAIAVSSTAPPPPPSPIAAAPPQPTGPVTIGDLDERMIEGKPPRYPMESRRRKEQGTVLLRLLIGTDGRVAQISIAQSSGFERLDQAALQAARGWRWQPMIRDGQPVEVRGVMPIPFVLQG